jgi:nicotinic acetylcholine receptor
MSNQTALNADNDNVYSVQLTIAFKRKPSFYTVIIVVPSILIISLALFGMRLGSHTWRHTAHVTGMFTPTSSSQEREEKCTLGSTALLTMSVILLIVTDKLPKEEAMNMPILGWSYCIVDEQVYA